MSKPIYLREETWLFLLRALSQLQGRLSPVLTELGYVLPPDQHFRENDVLFLLAEQPGPFLLYAGILNYPSLLEGTIIELVDGREFLINQTTAQALRKKEDIVVGVGIPSKESAVLERSEVLASLREGLLFDQLSRQMVKQHTG